MRAYLVLAAIVASAGCGSPSSSCRTACQACAVTADCCGPGGVCTNNLCIFPSNSCQSCKAVGQSCTTAVDCCNSLPCYGGVCVNSTCRSAGQSCSASRPCCGAWICANGVCGTTPACGKAGQACGTGCCAGLTCQGGSCAAPVTNQPIGYPCTSNSECASGDCTAWCTDYCASDNDCGLYAWCLLNSQQLYKCFPNCNTNADCLQFGAGVTCMVFTSIDGAAATACSK